MSNISALTRLAVLISSGFKCVYCGGEATEVDHRVALNRGGTDDIANLVSSCRHCNASKGDQLLPRSLPRRLPSPPAFPLSAPPAGYAVPLPPPVLPPSSFRSLPTLTSPIPPPPPIRPSVAFSAPRSTPDLFLDPEAEALRRLLFGTSVLDSGGNPFLPE